MHPQIIHIRSDNADFQLLESLSRNRKKRNQHGLFLVEGVRPINLALQHGWEFEALLIPDQLEHSRWAHTIMEQAGAAKHYLIAEQGYDLLTERHEGSELMALLRLPDTRPKQWPIKQNMRLVLLDRPSNPGNLGTIIRSCDAFGVDGVGIVGHAVDPFSREAIRASTGSLFAVPIVHFPGPSEVETWLDTAKKQLGSIQLIGTDEHGDQTARDYSFKGTTILVCGNETSGMSAGLRQMCNVTVQIPITGSASSLNVAVATSILLYEMNQ